MKLRLLVMALCVIAIAAPASAQTPDLAAIARMSGTPGIPGLKVVWLAPWGDVSKAHPWRNIIVHQTEGPAGSARGGATRTRAIAKAARWRRWPGSGESDGAA